LWSAITGWFSHLLEDIGKRGKNWQEIRKQGLWENRIDWKLLFVNPYEDGNNDRESII
jgi:hypothetical protein